MSTHIGIPACTVPLIYICVLAWSKIMSTFSNLDRVWIFLTELYQSGADFYLILQIFKWTLESWEFIEANSLFPAVFSNIPGTWYPGTRYLQLPDEESNLSTPAGAKFQLLKDCNVLVAGATAYTKWQLRNQVPGTATGVPVTTGICFCVRASWYFDEKWSPMHICDLLPVCTLNDNLEANRDDVFYIRTSARIFARKPSDTGQRFKRMCR